jgi:hypothetical protein
VKVFSRSEWSDGFLAGFTAYYLTSLPVLLGVWFGVSFLHPPDVSIDPVSACFRFDTGHQLQIIREGYSYNPAERSLVAFFPAYPLLSRWVNQSTGLTPEKAALLVANVALLGAFVLLARWIHVRWPEATEGQRGLILAVFGLWPLGLFFRMPYAESLFLCGTLAVLYGMAREWPLVTLALLTGFVTAVCPVGVALTAAFLWHILARPGPRPWAKAGHVLLLAPLACWGLLAYMEYQWLAFGTPWGFAQTQKHWSMLVPWDRSWPTKLGALAALDRLPALLGPYFQLRYSPVQCNLLEPDPIRAGRRVAGAGRSETVADGGRIGLGNMLIGDPLSDAEL